MIPPMKIKQQLELYQTCKTKRPQSNLKERKKKKKKRKLEIPILLSDFRQFGASSPLKAGNRLNEMGRRKRLAISWQFLYQRVLVVRSMSCHRRFSTLRTPYQSPKTISPMVHQPCVLANANIDAGTRVFNGGMYVLPSRYTEFLDRASVNSSITISDLNFPSNNHCRHLIQHSKGISTWIFWRIDLLFGGSWIHV